MPQNHLQKMLYRRNNWKWYQMKLKEPKVKNHNHWQLQRPRMIQIFIKMTHSTIQIQVCNLKLKLEINQVNSSTTTYRYQNGHITMIQLLKMARSRKNWQKLPSKSTIGAIFTSKLRKLRRIQTASSDLPILRRSRKKLIWIMLPLSLRSRKRSVLIESTSCRNLSKWKQFKRRKNLKLPKLKRNHQQKSHQLLQRSIYKHWSPKLYQNRKRMARQMTNNPKYCHRRKLISTITIMKRLQNLIQPKTQPKPKLKSY